MSRSDRQALTYRSRIRTPGSRASWRPLDLSHGLDLGPCVAIRTAKARRLAEPPAITLGLSRSPRPLARSSLRELTKERRVGAGLLSPARVPEQSGRSSECAATSGLRLAVPTFSIADGFAVVQRFRAEFNFNTEARSGGARPYKNSSRPPWWSPRGSTVSGT
jgi:hypothetical protein